MSVIVTRTGKGSPLTNAEVDANFTNLNSDKVEKTSAAITGGTIDGTTIGGTTPAAGTFTTLTPSTAILANVRGAIDLAAGSSGVNISNGGTVTAITATGGGSSYTSIPAVVITAPTTAGGVQATATVTMLSLIHI